MKIRHALAPIALAIPLATLGMAGPTAAQDAQAQADREARLQESLDGARLVGQFTVVGAAGASRPPQAEQYAVSNLERTDDGRWVFNVSMSYGTQQHTMPVPVTIEWAADTPMITMTEQTIEGLGTFTARVLLYDGLYAGTWKHGQFGGHMFGRIEPPGTAAPDAAAPDTAAPGAATPPTTESPASAPSTP